MINQQLLKPSGIVIVGGSDDVRKPGGKVLKNLLDGHFSGDLYVVNPKMDEVQGVKSFRDPSGLPDVDLAILAIAAKYCPDTVRVLAREKNTRAFIILSAGFSEESEEGAKLENQIVEIIDEVNGCLIGPNCIGFLNEHYHGVFTTPVPKLEPEGCDFISGSGATAVFIMESGMPKGLSFSSVYSVGNSAQIGVEDVLKYMDESFDPATSSRVKLLYIESIEKPNLLLKHASSLIHKGCKIAAIKAGGSEAGSRAATSHTGALASSDMAVDALFRKAGIVRCFSREELTTVASVFKHKELKGKNVAIITHAGGPAVMLTDVLSNGGLEIPEISGPKADKLLEKLYPGSSVSNPIDFLATGTAGQLGAIIDACEHDFDFIDAMVVIFGSPGLLPVFDVYELLDKKMQTCKKPIYPVLPSVINVKEEIEAFLAKGRINFPDEVVLGEALVKVFHASAPAKPGDELKDINREQIRKIIDGLSGGYLTPDKVQQLLDAAGISQTREVVVHSREDAVKEAENLRFPVVMKVVGPVHKSDIGGVVLDINTRTQVEEEFERMIQINEVKGILIQPMLSGIELFAGAKQEPKFGHLILYGLGGIFIEVLKDVKASLAPLSMEEAGSMIKKLRGYGIVKGVREQDGVNEEQFAEILVRISNLVKIAPEIYEMDINPLLGNRDRVVAVDARIRIEK
ncbi:MAG: CoA-binding protein [Bacteroidetes bacterium]|nr:CoA-binding protein [Bacteroidota bacterium]